MEANIIFEIYSVLDDKQNAEIRIYCMKMLIKIN